MSRNTTTEQTGTITGWIPHAECGYLTDTIGRTWKIPRGILPPGPDWLPVGTKACFTGEFVVAAGQHHPRIAQLLECTVPSKPRLRIPEVTALEPAELADYMNSSFNALTTVVIADAENKLRDTARQLLRSPAWRDRWLDGLEFLDGDVQIAMERAQLDNTVHAQRLAEQLPLIRIRLHQARELAAEQHHARVRALSDRARRTGHDTAATARSWLANTHDTEFAELCRDLLAQRGIPTTPPRAGVAAAVDLGLADPPTASVLALTTMSDTVFRETVARDVLDQDDRNLDLAHPFVADRWDTALRDLLTDNAGWARASSIEDLGTLTVNLHAMDRTRAKLVLNSRRFFCALIHRRAACARVISHWCLRIVEHENDDTSPQRRVLVEAEQILCARHHDVYTRILQQLRAFEAAPGVLRADLDDRQTRNRVKATVLVNAMKGPGAAAPDAA